MKKIAVYTSGGDAPGMNACIRAVARTAIYYDIEIMGIMRGYEGMIENEIIPMDSRMVANIIQKGGTILKTSRSKEFETKEGRAKAYQNLKENNIEGLVCIGGNGSYMGAKFLGEEYPDISIVGLPGTIDNDIWGTDYTIGYDTAVNTALDAIDKIRDTADSHNRTFFVEVMGRHAGDIALSVGIGSGAEAVLVPEVEDDFLKLKSYFMEQKSNKSFSIIIVAEGEQAGGAFALVEKLKKYIPKFDARVAVLGHIQRGGKPLAFDRLLATQLGVSAVENLKNGTKGKAIGIVANKIHLSDFEEAISNKKFHNKFIMDMIPKLNI